MYKIPWQQELMNEMRSQETLAHLLNGYFLGSVLRAG